MVLYITLLKKNLIKCKNNKNVDCGFVLIRPLSDASNGKRVHDREKKSVWIFLFSQFEGSTFTWFLIDGRIARPNIGDWLRRASFKWKQCKQAAGHGPVITDLWKQVRSNCLNKKIGFLWRRANYKLLGCVFIFYLYFLLLWPHCSQLN